ncbi:restriction endonuclease fold toxin 5 domain-containing protein [Burkholderia sp. 22PA0099]|uniref:restriction endonuclease fold toxin 5 domain-containing protein n=1 Tax=Burkholderia sp. 22PA0099 TaxID=3237372 RepID=UPI0039C18C72
MVLPLILPLLGAAGAAVSEALPAAAGIAAAGALTSSGDTTKDQTKTKARAVPQANKPCKKCPPDSGKLVTRNWNMSERSREYQARITGFAPRTEWNFSGTDFDGFRSQYCSLEEAKAAYDQFFDREDGNPKFFFNTFGVGKIIKQAAKHSNVATANPPATVNWYFMQPLSYRYFTRRFMDAAPEVETFYQP